MRLLIPLRLCMITLLSLAQATIGHTVHMTFAVARPVFHLGHIGLDLVAAVLDRITPQPLAPLHDLLHFARCSVKHIHSSIHRMASPSNQRAGQDASASFAFFGDRTPPLLC